MTLATYAVALFWVLAYAWLGWAGVLLVAGVGMIGEALLLSIGRLQAAEDRATALERLAGYRVAERGERAA